MASTAGDRDSDLPKSTCSMVMQKSKGPVTVHKTGVVSASSTLGDSLSVRTVSEGGTMNQVREETEWERCSRNPEVARKVKTRNLVERRRLEILHSQLDRELEKELKRLTTERREFSDVLENLRRRRRQSRELNVRTQHLRSVYLVNDTERNLRNLQLAEGKKSNQICLPAGFSHLCGPQLGGSEDPRTKHRLSDYSVISAPDLGHLSMSGSLSFPNRQSPRVYDGNRMRNKSDMPRHLELAQLQPRSHSATHMLQSNNPTSNSSTPSASSSTSSSARHAVSEIIPL
ncbi:unnamed protein product [Calicophoron daubneyi]|uniref:BZIP domain-containing protein n=1 Tax=Calicophoron daubneyi TaxID=300641 RepID=A0AAV2TUX0_CALDB